MATQLIDLIRDIIGEKNDWITRQEIARKLGRSKEELYPYDVTLLKRLADTGQIECQETVLPGAAVKIQYQYRLK